MKGSIDTMEKSFTAFVMGTPCMLKLMASKDASLFTALVLGVLGDGVRIFLGPMSLLSLPIIISEASALSALLELSSSLLLLLLGVVASSAVSQESGTKA